MDKLDKREMVLNLMEEHFKRLENSKNQFEIPIVLFDWFSNIIKRNKLKRESLSNVTNISSVKADKEIKDLLDDLKRAETKEKATQAVRCILAFFSPD